MLLFATLQASPALIALVVLAVLVIGGWVLWSVFRDHRRMAESRGVYKALAEELGLKWSPPKSSSDAMSPGRVEGRYRDHKVTLDHTTPTGAARNLMPETVIRVRFAESLKLGIHGGVGTFRARNPGDLALEDARLSKLLRVKAKDEAGAKRLFSDPEVANAIASLDEGTRGVGIDDGTLSIAIELPLSTTALRASLDRVVDAVETFDRRS